MRRGRWPFAWSGALARRTFVGHTPRLQDRGSRPMIRSSTSFATVCVALVLMAPARAASQHRGDSSAWTQLHFRYIGPEGNRVSSVVGVPGDPDTYYAGAASGGLWKTTDGGTRWSPI